MYKRIASVESEYEGMVVMDEFIDRFGAPPESVKGLVDVALIRNSAAKAGIYEVKQRKDSIAVYVSDIKPKHITALSAVFRRRAFIGSDKGKQYVVIKLMNEAVLKTLDNVVRVFEMPLEV